MGAGILELKTQYAEERGEPKTEEELEELNRLGLMESIMQSSGSDVEVES